MSRAFRSPNDFVWPGTEVLRNKLGLREQAELTEAERRRTSGRILQLRLAPVSGNFDLQHLQAIHAHLFQDVYGWAGQVRSFPLSKGGDLFCQPEHIGTYAGEVFGRLAGKDALRGLDEDTFVDEAAELLGDLNALHPFREGNGRTQRAFLEQLSDGAGHPIVWPDGVEERNIVASRASLRGDNTGLGALIAEGLQPAVPRGGEAEGARSGEGTPPGAALTEEERDVAEGRGGRRTKTIQDIVNTATEAGGREQGPV